MLEQPSDNQTLSSSAIGSFFTGLWEGATQASIAGCIGILLVTGLWSGVCLIFVTPERLAKIDYRYWVTVHADQHAEVSFRAIRIAQADPLPFAVVVFGDSGSRDVITDWAVVEEALAKELGQPAPVYDLSANGLNIIEMAGLMDLVDEGFNGIIVLHIGQYHLAQTQNDLAEIAYIERLALKSPVYFDELTRVASKPPRHADNYFIDHWRFFAPRLNSKFMKQLLLGPTPERLAERKPLNEVKWKQRADEVTAYLANYKNQRDRNRAILDRMIDRVRGNGYAEIVLLEPPLNPKADTLLSPELAQDHRRFMRRWCQEKSLHYWDLNTEAELVVEHFFDYIHIDNPEAEERYTDLLADKLARLVAKSQWETEVP